MAESDVQAILRELGVIQTKLDAVVESGKDHEKRLRLLEGAGGRRWDGAIMATVSAVIGAVIGALITSLTK